MNVGSFFVIFEVLYLHRSLLILFAFNAFIVILSSFPVTTPSDMSFSEEALYLQSRFLTNVSGVDQDNNDAAGANLFFVGSVFVCSHRQRFGSSNHVNHVHRNISCR